jgi:hypothetical protein
MLVMEKAGPVFSQDEERGCINLSLLFYSAGFFPATSRVFERIYPGKQVRMCGESTG